MYSEILNNTRLSVRQLQMCVAVDRTTSLGAAGELLHVSPSAVSMGIREAEEQLGSQLFHRVHKSLKANEAGRFIIPKMEELLRQFGELSELLSEARSALSGHLVIGASSTLGCYQLPERIAGFLKKHPQVEIDLVVGNTAEILSQLSRSELDLAFVEGPSSRSDCELERLWKDEMVVFAANGVDLCQRKRLRWTDLETEPWLLREQGSGTHSILASQFAKLGMHPRRVNHVGNTEAVIRCVEQGLGIACLSRSAIERSLEVGRIVVLPVAPLVRYFFRATVPNRYSGLVAERFLAEL